LRYIHLSDEERLRVNSHRERAKRKLKIARVLATEELLEEARQALEEAILYQGRAYAVEARLSEPENPGDVLMSPREVAATSLATSGQGGQKCGERRIPAEALAIQATGTQRIRPGRIDRRNRWIILCHLKLFGKRSHCNLSSQGFLDPL
jgi:hypothetical protein